MLKKLQALLFCSLSFNPMLTYSATSASGTNKKTYKSYCYTLKYNVFIYTELYNMNEFLYQGGELTTTKHNKGIKNLDNFKKNLKVTIDQNDINKCFKDFDEAEMFMNHAKQCGYLQANCQY